MLRKIIQIDDNSGKEGSRQNITSVSEWPFSSVKCGARPPTLRYVCRVQLNSTDLGKFAFLLAASIISISAHSQDNVHGQVIAVLDGNTLEIKIEQSEDVFKVMLVGIDCPELEQAYGERAKEFTEKLLHNKNVTIVWAGKDRWGTRLAVIYFQEADVRLKLLHEGLAWTSERNPAADLEQIKEEVKRERRGLWADDAPVAPWVFRRQQTMLTPKTS